MLKHFLVHCLLAALLAVSQLSNSGYARSLPITEALSLPVRQETKISESAIVESTVSDTAIAVGSATTRVSYNSSQNTTEMRPESTTLLVARTPTEGDDTASAVKHIRRKKREMEAETPYDFHTTHLFCDLDIRGKHHIMWYFPNHCIWIWNNKYVHEGFYRLYKMYQLDGFFFGQVEFRITYIEYEKRSFSYV